MIAADLERRIGRYLPSMEAYGSVLLSFAEARSLVVLLRERDEALRRSRSRAGGRGHEHRQSHNGLHRHAPDRRGFDDRRPVDRRLAVVVTIR